MTTHIEENIKVNEFLKKLYKLYEEDGMMRCMYKLFEKQIAENAFSLDELTILSVIQDEYQKLYDQYYQLRNVAETEGLDRILSNKNVSIMETNSNAHPLLLSYLSFIRAERMYFTKDYAGAIREYKEAITRIEKDHCNDMLSDIDKERCAYLKNSIAWSYNLQNDKSTAIKIYSQLFEEYKDIDRYFFAWRYRRNYGVCLEGVGEYLQAIQQYEKVLNIPEVVNEYKIYLTYCSAIMKYWDRETGKLSGNWIYHVKDMYKKNVNMLSDDAFARIDACLKLADLKKRTKDFENMMPDYYNQMTKMLTYKLIISSDLTNESGLVYEIIKNLKILENISPNAWGRHYIKRDFYYALYELSQDETEKEEYFQTAYNENKMLLGRGDAVEFDAMLKSKK